jgi:hypothetical protein
MKNNQIFLSVTFQALNIKVLTANYRNQKIHMSKKITNSKFWFKSSNPKLKRIRYSYTW